MSISRKLTIRVSDHFAVTYLIMHGIAFGFGYAWSIGKEPMQKLAFIALII